MNFLKRLFSCGRSQLTDDTPSYLPSLCFQKKKRKDPNSKDLTYASSSSILKTTSLSPHMQDGSQSPVKIMNINTKIMQNRQKKTVKLENFDMGFLIGTINGYRLNPLLGQALGKTVRYQIQKQCKDIKSLRPFALDNLMVYWSQLGCNFQIKDLILVKQNLVIIAEEWQTVKLVIFGYQEELKNMAEEIMLSQIKHRLLYNITKVDSFYAISFKETIELQKQLSKSQAKETLYKLTLEQLNVLASKITLQEYIQLTKNNQSVLQKIKRVLVKIEIQQPIMVEVAQIKKDELVAPYHKEVSRQSLSVKVVDTLAKMEFKDTKSYSDCEEEIKYFSAKKVKSPQILQQKIQHELDIFNLDNEQTIENLQDEKPTPQHRYVALVNKKRSRSEVLKPDQIVLDYEDDGELFDKYQ